VTKPGKRGKGSQDTIADRFAAVRKIRDDRFAVLRERLNGMPPIFKSVHEAMEIDPEVFKEPRKARGTGFGRVVHRAMQQCLLTEEFDPQVLLDQWMEEEGVPARQRADLVATIEALKNHPRILEARASTEKYCEWEYFLTREDGIHNGVIDLVYKSPSGDWVIVDYKTDDVSDPERKAKLDVMYGTQLKFYAAAFMQITGHHVSDTIALFTEELLYKKQ
jgi:ATP-dependent exoDNAse (exonuclease V) beta subunit